MHPDEQTILVNWYNSLPDANFWDTSNDLCGQTGVTCDTSIDQRVKQLYTIFSFYLFINIDIIISQLFLTYSLEIDQYLIGNLLEEQFLQNLEG